MDNIDILELILTQDYITQDSHFLVTISLTCINWDTTTRKCREEEKIRYKETSWECQDDLMEFEMSRGGTIYYGNDLCNDNLYDDDYCNDFYNDYFCVQTSAALGCWEANMNLHKTGVL